MTGRRRVEADEVTRLRNDLAAAAAEVTPLAEIAPIAGELDRVQPLLEQLAGAVASLLGTDLAIVWTCDAQEQVLVPAAWVGFSDDYVGPLRVPYGTGSAGRAVSESRTVLFTDVERAQEYAPWRAGALQHGVRAVLSVPMLTLGGEAVGALSSYYRQAADPDPRDLDLADVFARQAAEIVERARLHASSRQLAELERRRGRQLRALADSALSLSAVDDLDTLLALVSEAARDVVGCRRGATTRWSTGAAGSVTCASGSDEGSDLPADDDRALSVRLVGRAGGELGVVRLSGKVDGAAFTAEDEAVLVQLAQMASATVERIEALAGERAARQQAEASAEAQALLSEASSVFAEIFDADGIARSLLALVVPRLADVAELHLVGPDGRVSRAAFGAADEAVRARLEDVGDPADEPRYGAAAALATGAPQRRDVEPSDPAGPGLWALSVPLLARGRVVGALSLLRPAAYPGSAVAHAVDLANRAALAVDNANRYAFERDLALTLQRSLLPRRLATGSGFTAAARYLPGALGTQVGGDWYDTIEVASGLVLVVGDVMGRGVHAAAQMGQLQATVRAYALEGHGPAALLERLDRVVLGAEELQLTTCVLVHLDPVTRRAVLASAGHLPPVLVRADGTAELLDLEPALPLGVGGARFVERAVQLDAGAALLLYTDGLVEDRSCSVDVGLARLLAAVGGPAPGVEQLCDRVLVALGRDGGHDDDTALLAVRLAPAPALRVVLAAVPGSAALARHAVSGLLGPVPARDAVELLVSEVVANAVRHAGGGDVVVTADVGAGVLRVAVQDDSRVLPGPPVDPGLDAESGRGLLLVQALALAWGTELLPGGKRVWFELALDDG